MSVVLAPFPPVQRTASTQSVRWRWWLVDTKTMTQIAELTTAHQRQIQFQLNSWGKATFWLHPLDPLTEYIRVHQTALRCDRNGKTWWSGPIWQATDNADNAGGDQCQVTAMGWLKTLDKRLVHTGADFASMLAAWVASTGGSYVPLGQDTAVQLAYTGVVPPPTGFTRTANSAGIILDLLQRANIDAPTRMTPGVVIGDTTDTNLTLQVYAQVGQQVQNLVNVENGPDIYVDPITRQMNLYDLGASSCSLIPRGMGSDAGASALLTFPGNCISANRSHDGTRTSNRVISTGQYGYGRADDLVAQADEDLFEEVVTLSNVVDPNILAAFANAEVAVTARPWTIITMTPRALGPGDVDVPGVPRPFDDFFLGDLVRGVVDYGPRFQVGTEAAGASGPQPLRVFGFNIDIDDGGTERLSSLATTYQGVASGTG